MIDLDARILDQPVRLVFFDPDSAMFSAEAIKINRIPYRLRCYFKRESWGWRIESSHVGLDREDWRKDATDGAMRLAAEAMRDMLAKVGSDPVTMHEAKIDKLMADRKRALADAADFARKATEAANLATRLYNEAIALNGGTLTKETT